MVFHRLFRNLGPFLVAAVLSPRAVLSFQVTGKWEKAHGDYTGVFLQSCPEVGYFCPYSFGQNTVM